MKLRGTISMGLGLVKAKAKQKPLPPDWREGFYFTRIAQV
jgi:hypothetical protein